MANNTINFRENFNNKLLCKYFTTIRDCSNYSRMVGATFNVTIDKLFVKKAILIRCDPILLSTLDDIFTYMDSGVSKVEFLNVFEDFYPHHDVSSFQFYRLLFKTLYESA